MARRLGFVGCRYNTAECMEQVLEDGFAVDHLVTISEETAARNRVSGYMDLRPFAEKRGIPCTVASRYSLKSRSDREVVLKLGLDILLVIGWQRLIPPWLLDSLAIGAFGMHGSPDPLPEGRGRSPLNWSLILGRDRFETNLFQYDAGVDSGKIAGTQTFDVNEWDDIYSLHLKNRVSMNLLLSKALPGLLSGTLRLTGQLGKRPSYYPKRTPEDGMIDWGKTSRELYDFCRGVTKPYPGAFSFIGSHLVRIWQMLPFDSQLRFPERAVGEIAVVAGDGALVVRTVDGSVLVRECETEDDYAPARGDRFHTPGPWKQRVQSWRERQIPGPATGEADDGV